MRNGIPSGANLAGVIRSMSVQQTAAMQEYRFTEPVTINPGDLFCLAMEHGKVCGYVIKRADGTVERHIEEPT